MFFFLAMKKRMPKSFNRVGLILIRYPMKQLSFEQMENIQGGGTGLDAACIAGGLALSLLSGPAFALTFSLTAHVCLASILDKIKV
jgi:hypothetical protein